MGGSFSRGLVFHACEELAVWMAKLTAVSPLPAGMTVGETVQVAPVGRPDTETLAAFISVVDPSGVTVSAKVAVPPAPAV